MSNLYNTWAIDKIRRKLASMYVGNETDLKRELLVHKSMCNYGSLGAVFFALNGSPPKGYAIYVPEHQYIIFINAWGDKKITYKNAWMDLEVL